MFDAFDTDSPASLRELIAISLAIADASGLIDVGISLNQALLQLGGEGVAPTISEYVPVPCAVE